MRYDTKGGMTMAVRELDPLERVTSADSDAAVAKLIADHLLESVGARGYYILSIFHDVRKRSTAGPCPVEYDWHRKNIVGIRTKDRAQAERWIVECELLGYGVFRHYSTGGFAAGPGAIQEVRQRAVDAQARSAD
jgi:hypothetical protein